MRCIVYTTALKYLIPQIEAYVGWKFEARDGHDENTEMMHWKIDAQLQLFHQWL